tara:strand:+ start:2394 stop:2717 length:324 start_codon:yes stop_codon:yes gene_type:complete
MGVTAAVAAVVGTGYSVYSGEKQKKQQKKALAMQSDANVKAESQAKAQADRADVSQNRANRKKANVSGIMSAANQAGKSGAAGTMLTGSMGVDPSSLNLGSNTLLGG